jgi:hypothetical protein
MGGRGGEAPAELLTHQARQEPGTPDGIASNSKIQSWTTSQGEGENKLKGRANC